MDIMQIFFKITTCNEKRIFKPRYNHNIHVMSTPHFLNISVTQWRRTIFKYSLSDSTTFFGGVTSMAAIIS